jgi:putative phosphoesterase
MKIAIVSDTHNNWPNFKKAIEWIKKENIKLVLHCGDISAQEIVTHANALFKEGEIKYVRGNADYDLPDIPDELTVEFNSKKIGFVHFPDEAKKMAQSGKYDMVFYGHTHRAWDEKIGNCHMINPGEMAGQFYKATFAVYDTSTGELELKILEKI